MRIGTARQLGALAQQRRLDLGLSAVELARRARVSRKWLHDFETGKATVQLTLALHVVTALGLQVQVVAGPAEARPAAAGPTETGRSEAGAARSEAGAAQAEAGAARSEVGAAR